MSSFGGQFLLLMWKNYKLQSRRKLLTVFEIILPLLLAIMLLVIRMLSTDYGEPVYTLSPSVEVPAQAYWSKNRILYSPKNTFTTNIISYVSRNYKQQSTLNSKFVINVLINFFLLVLSFSFKFQPIVKFSFKVIESKNKNFLVMVIIFYE